MRTPSCITRPTLLLAAVTLACNDAVAPGNTTADEPQLTAALFGFDYSGAYDGSLLITLDYRDLHIFEPTTPGHHATRAWAEASFVSSSSSPYCTWPLPCPVDRWWIVITAYSPVPGTGQPRFMELRIPSRGDGMFGGTYEYACSPDDESFLPACVFTGSIRDEHCAPGGDSMPLWCLFGDTAGHIMFGLDGRFVQGIGWTGQIDPRGISTARVTIDEAIPLSPYPAPAQRLRGTFTATLPGSEDGDAPVQIANGRFDLEVR